MFLIKIQKIRLKHLPLHVCKPGKCSSSLLKPLKMPLSPRNYIFQDIVGPSWGIKEFLSSVP